MDGCVEAMLPNLLLETWYRWPYIPELHQQTSKLPICTIAEKAWKAFDIFETPKTRD